MKIELPKGTLLLAEKVVEYRGTVSCLLEFKRFHLYFFHHKFYLIKQESVQQKTNTIHVIDAYFVEFENVLFTNFSYSHTKVQSIDERNSRLDVFIKAVTKKSRRDLSLIRRKELFDVEDLDSKVLSK